MMLKFTLCLISLGMVVGIQTCLCETFLVNEGSSTKLTCINQSFRGKLVTVSWGKDGGVFIAQKFVSGVVKYVMEDKYFIDDNMMYLKIGNIEYSDQGKYTCKAEIDSENHDEDDVILHHTIELLVSKSELVDIGNATHGMQKQTGSSFAGYAVCITIIVVLCVIVVVLVVIITRMKKTYMPVTSDSPKVT
ncbi:uncharacterized protein [Ptychodera flava]|uniref:uncharacterized protein n=1 Tax=Ptychodera flava TaxID=63121 RepID=UPI003969C3DB